MKTVAAFSLASALLASAQQTYTIDPNSVDNNTRAFWCQSQQTQCPVCRTTLCGDLSVPLTIHQLICLQPPTNTGSTIENSCDPNGLTYSCVCGNGVSPNVSEYSQTLPFFLCQTWGNQCVSNCGNDNTCQSACRDDHPCGALNPTRQNTSTLTSTSTASASGSGTNAPAGATTSGGQTIYTGLGGDAPSNTAESGSAAATASSAAMAMRATVVHYGQSFGLITIVGAFFGGFALLL